MRKSKDTKGITLIALIITVILLLILAMVSINLTINGGILQKAKEGEDKYKIAETNEQEQLDTMLNEIKKANGETEEIKITSINFNANTTDMSQTSNTTITATIEPANASNQQLAWSLDNTNAFEISNIDQNTHSITVSKKQPYEQYYSLSSTFEQAYITATAQDGSNVTASYRVYYYSSVCFTAGTKVLTEKGLINIEDIKVGDKVYSKNEVTDETELKDVLNTFIHDDYKDLVKIYTENEVIESTSKHKYYEKSKGWIEAYKLQIGDILIDSDGKEVKIRNTEFIRGNKPTKVYNLNVKDNHNYFVGEDRVLVHNAAEPC